MYRGEMHVAGAEAVLFSGSAHSAHLSDAEEIESRFGRVTVNPRQPLAFTNGMLGMPDKINFCLTTFPSEKMARFKLLQSLDDIAVSFITLPVDLGNPIIERTDLELAAQDLGMPLADVTILLVVNVNRETGAAKLTVNACAPILVNTRTRHAVQHVFAHNKYLIRQPLSL